MKYLSEKNLSESIGKKIFDVKDKQNFILLGVRTELGCPTMICIDSTVDGEWIPFVEDLYVVGDN